jgi:hypothetical protein
MSDEGWDPVWEARTSVDEEGWNAEFRIPFSQLRFTDRNPQVWGLNVRRWVPARNEEDFWSLIGRNEQRWTSLFGDLTGIDDIGPSRRLELLPYVASSSRITGDPDPRDPFTRGINLQGRTGLDAKVGVGSNLTLEAAINPDFGQVEADPAEVNLSTIETFFPEQRPFFVEGSQLMLGRVGNLFYSRRIGARPLATAAGEFVDAPLTSTILGAAKLTGRLASGTSIGMLAAVTDQEFARTFTQSQFNRVRVTPRALYGNARVEQEFGEPGSAIGLMVNGVHRDLDARDPLSSLIVRDAFSVAADSTIRLNDGRYEALWAAAVTHVAGTAAAVDRVQRGSQRYMQRPDIDYLTYDPTRTSLTGARLGAGFTKRNGRHWIWQAEHIWETPGFETNDIGRLTGTDSVVARGYLEYHDNQPAGWRRNYAFRVTAMNEWNFGWVAQFHTLQPQLTVTWPNFWQTQLSLFTAARTQDERLTRGGPSMEHPTSWRANLRVQNSSAASNRADLQGAYGRDEDGGLFYQTNLMLAMQPRPQWQFSVKPAYEREVNTQQYVATVAGGRVETFGSRFVFAHVDRSTYSTQVRVNYTFKPDLTLDFYGEPFAASGRYYDIGELARSRTRLIRLYGTDNTSVTRAAEGVRVTDSGVAFILPSRDFNVQSFRSNVVLRWEWRAGSTLYLVWQQNRSAMEPVAIRASLADMFGSIGQSGDTFFAIKSTFWMSPR